MSEIYISTDVETDGPIPGKYSMLSLGAAAFTLEKGLVGKFSVNLERLPGAIENPSTMDWWKTQPEAWKACRENQENPDQAIRKYSDWVVSFGTKPVFVGYPAGFDFLFVYWYLINFMGESPFSFSALDIKTYAAAVMKCDYRNATKRNMPKRWFSNSPHTHKSLDDAIEQGELFCNILKENLGSYVHKSK